MTRNIALISLCVLPFLAACGTPQENCIRQNTREYRAVSGLLAETEANLARGYAWQERQVTRTRFTDCQRVLRSRDGARRVETYPCWRDYTDVERFRVAIDPAVEERKRANLAERVATLGARNDQVLRQCAAAYPEAG
ncbi:MAG: hypothetical protein Q4G36_01215 [Paracoccus sp. (in: a-proteobacteria)]|nr:hypothetical protein [Paracoccus sp. (in: a-proteobacteria)]